MTATDLDRFVEKIRQLNAFVALSELDPSLRQALIDCAHHNDVVALAQRHGFEISRRWGDPPPIGGPAPSLLSDAGHAPELEKVDVLLRTAHFRLERIHRCGPCQPPTGWVEQSAQQWLCLLQGGVVLQLADEVSPRQLRTGDTLLISPGRRHRVLATDPPPGTIWLALFWPLDPAV